MEDLIQNVRGSKKPKNAKMQLLIPFNPYPPPLQRLKNFKNVVYTIQNPTEDHIP